jgi:hypothetical protein
LKREEGMGRGGGRRRVGGGGLVGSMIFRNGRKEREGWIGGRRNVKWKRIWGKWKKTGDTVGEEEAKKRRMSRKIGGSEAEL